MTISRIIQSHRPRGPFSIIVCHTPSIWILGVVFGSHYIGVRFYAD